MKKITAVWVRRAEGNLVVAELALSQSLGELSIFHCRQALEKLLKAILIERSPAGRTRRTHDLVLLGKLVGYTFSDAQFEFLRELYEMYVPSRYGDEDVDFEYRPPEEWVRLTKELFSWLRPLLS